MVAVLKATKEGVELIQPGTPQRPQAQIALDTIIYDAEENAGRIVDWLAARGFVRG